MRKEKKIVFLSLTPAKIVHCDKELATNKKNEHILDTTHKYHSSSIMLKECALLATKTNVVKINDQINYTFNVTEIDAYDTLCFVSPCKKDIMSNYAISSYMLLATNNLLQSFIGAFEIEISPTISSLRKTEHPQVIELQMTSSMGDEDDVELETSPIQKGEDDEDNTL